ncbi:MAG: nucleoside deaminase [Pseudomonadota bacterium]
MTTSDSRKADQRFMRAAFAAAKKGYDQGGVPVGAVMVRDGEVIASGCNKRVQENDPVMHGETDCLRTAGIQDSYSGVDLYTTLSPCMMCTGAILHFGIQRVVVGEDVNFPGNIDFLRDNGVEVVLLDDPECKALMARFINEKPEIWFEDIAGNESV